MLLEIPADGESPTVPGAEGTTTPRTLERVADYEYAAPGGLRWLTIVEPYAWRAGETEAAPGGTVYEQISPPGGWLSGSGVQQGSPPTGGAVLNVVMDVDQDALDLFHGWYDEEHLPRLVQVPGIDAARRFRAVAGSGPGEGRDRFLALYELRDADVVASDEFAGASVMTPRTEQVVARLSWASQLYRAR